MILIYETIIYRPNAQLNRIIEKGYSIYEVIKSQYKQQVVVENPLSPVEAAAKIMEESANSTAAPTKTEHNMFK